jgi:CubicO group peptidase (beta-lactamase class C family)
LAIAKGDEILFEGAYGFANLESNVPAKSETRYRAASVSKWFTATAAFKLVESGDLNE